MNHFDLYAVITAETWSVLRYIADSNGQSMWVTRSPDQGLSLVKYHELCCKLLDLFLAMKSGSYAVIELLEEIEKAVRYTALASHATEVTREVFLNVANVHLNHAIRLAKPFVRVAHGLTVRVSK